jgi:hypothetical protein
VDTDYLASGVKVWCNHEQAATFVIHDSLNITSVKAIITKIASAIITPFGA